MRFATVIFSLLVAAGCSAQAPAVRGAGSLDDLRAAIDDGADCAQLFAIFDGIDEQGAESSTAQGELINVGCYTRTSERNDAELSSLAPDSPWLGVPGREVTPSSDCTSASVAAANESDAERAEPLIAATLDACVSVDEWMSALALHPGVMGMSEGYNPQLLDLQSVCYSYVESAVCQDALARDIAVGP